MKKININPVFRKILIIIFLFSIYFFISAFSYTKALSKSISNNLLRLHVIANSNSSEDQNLKYIVRDELLNYMNELTYGYTSKQEIMLILNNHIDDFQKLSKEVILKNGFDYDVNIKVGNFDFPTKNYGDISLPAGSYEAIRVEIGEFKGENWWCVMFPPLCFVDVTTGIVPEDSKNIIKNDLNDEEYYLVSNKNSYDVQLKFKLFELFQNIKLANN